MFKVKALFWIIGLLLAGWIGYWVYLRLAPEETKIEWLLDGMAKGFNSSRAAATVEGIAEGFEEETAHVSRSDVHQFLLYLFLNEREPKTKEFRFRVKLGKPSISLLPMEGDGQPRAELKLDAEFLELQGQDFKPAWQVSIEAELEKLPEGWRVLRSRHRSLSGKRPF